MKSPSAGKRIPPHNLQAEESLIGAMLLSKVAIETAKRIVVPADFYMPAHGHICHAVLTLYENGDPCDAVTVSDYLGKTGMLESIGGPATLVSLQASTPATSNAARYATIVAEASQLRAIQRAAHDAVEMAYEAPDPGFVIDFLTAAIGRVDLSLGSIPDSLYVLDEFLAQAEERGKPPWVIPGLLRVGWRVVLVAAEGVGKSVLFRQIAIAAAQGIHPLSFDVIKERPPITLIVDLENPEDAIVDVCQPIRDEALGRAKESYDAERAWLWWQPQGMNLRSRAGRAKLEAVIEHVRPEVVAIGPLYKLYAVDAHERDEQAALEVMRILDDLRIRYRFGLLIEHHAPKGSGSSRDMTPYGSSLWLRWSEIGLTMTPVGDDPEDLSLMRLGRFRGDRVEHAWPNRVRRSKPWPFAGEWDAGSVRQPPDTVEEF